VGRGRLSGTTYSSSRAPIRWLSSTLRGTSARWKGAPRHADADYC
jgi:hypothetical protein